MCTTYLISYTQRDTIQIEPPSWWTGMKNPNLQLMIRAKDISNRPVKISRQGITLKKITKGDNPDFVFVDLAISPASAPGNMVIQLGNQKVNYVLNARTPRSAARQGYTNADAIYLITPDRFANGDPNNDNVPDESEKVNRTNKNGRHGGDIQGIVDHLDYIRDLGFTAIWPTPLLENNLPTFSYHGYAISDFYKVDPRFGSNESYRSMSESAKSRGLKLIMDIVLNHCGSGHWWMKDMPFKDWITYEGRYVNTNHRRESNMDPHASAYDKELMTQGWFVPSMPDLNQRNPFMATYLIQNTIWWIEYADLAGLRIDTYPYVDKTFSAQWSKAVMNEYPNLNMVGEEWSYNPMITSYWQRGMKNKDGYTSSLRSVMDFPLQDAMVRSLHDDGHDYMNGGWSKVYSIMAMDFIYADPGNLVIFPDNHDMIRFYTQIHEDFDLWKQGMVFTCTTRGIPEMFYGTEILTNTPSGKKDDGEIRSDMPGGWIGDTKNAFTKQGLTPKEIEAQSFLKQLLNLRKRTPALQSGRLIHFAPEGGVYVYFRIDANEKYMIMLSKRDGPVTLNANQFKEILGTSPVYRNALTHEIEPADQAMNIAKNGYKLFKIE